MFSSKIKPSHSFTYFKQLGYHRCGGNCTGGLMQTTVVWLSGSDVPFVSHLFVSARSRQIESVQVELVTCLLVNV